MFDFILNFLPSEISSLLPYLGLAVAIYYLYKGVKFVIKVALSLVIIGIIIYFLWPYLSAFMV